MDTLNVASAVQHALTISNLDTDKVDFLDSFTLIKQFDLLITDALISNSGGGWNVSCDLISTKYTRTLKLRCSKGSFNVNLKSGFLGKAFSNGTYTIDGTEYRFNVNSIHDIIKAAKHWLTLIH